MTNKRKIYLELFNLTESATLDEIKKRYRELAKMFHPDKNKEKNANERFLLIKEAYEYLINTPIEKPEAIYYENVDLEKERIEKIRIAKERLREYYKRKEIYLKNKYSHFKSSIIWKIFTISAILGLTLTVLIALEICIPTIDSNTKITEVSNEFNTISNDQIVLIKTSDYQTIFINKKIKEYIPYNDSITYNKTFILGLPKTITHKTNINISHYKINSNSFQVLLLFAIVFLIPVLIYYQDEQSEWFMFIVKFSTSFIVPIQLIFIVNKINVMYILFNFHILH